MGLPRMTRSLEATLKDFLTFFMEGQPTDFIASELLVSSEIIGHINPSSKFAKAIHAAEVSFPKQGFSWWEPPSDLRAIVDAVRYEVSRSRSTEEAMQTLYDLISEDSPAFLSHVRLH